MYPEHFGKNPMFPKSIDFEVLHKDDSAGFGVISYTDFKKGDLIAAITGEIITDIRQHSLQIEPGVHLYDTYFTGYFLHSCEPNVFLDMKNRLIYAVKDIKANDYLYMDYAQTEDVLYKQFPCGCGSAKCRGWITGKNEMSDEFEHFDQKRSSIG